MNNASQIKSNIIDVISKIDDLDKLIQLHNQIVENTISVPSFLEAVKPIKEDVPLEQLIEEQNYQPINYNEFRKKADSIGWNESLEELLYALK